MGQLIRYSIWLILTLLSICIIRFIFLTGFHTRLKSHLMPSPIDIGIGISSTPYFAASSFGAGWGAIISLSSYNKFSTNIINYSWVICSGQTLIMVMSFVLAFLLDYHFKGQNNMAHIYNNL